MSKKLNFRFLLLLVAGIFLSLNVVAQTITVKGHVQDTDGHPVVFASVTSVNPKALTNTDAAGNFSIKAQQGSKLRVSYIGYYCCPVNFQTAQESSPKPFRIGLRGFFFKKQAP